MPITEAAPRGRMLGVRAGPDLHRWLDEASQHTGLTRSELVRWVLRRAAQDGLSADVLAAATSAAAIKLGRVAGSRDLQEPA